MGGANRQYDVPVCGVPANDADGDTSSQQTRRGGILYVPLDASRFGILQYK